jgi:arginine deiminase
MRNRARQREALLSRAIFRFHPDFSSTPVLPELAAHAEAAKGDRPSSGGSDTVLEGGDVLVLSPEVIAVGHSERTTDAGIEALARALSNRAEGPRWLIRVDLPRERAFMHLDAVFTPVGREACLVFPPVMLPGSPRVASTWEYDLHAADPRPVARGPLLEALAARGIAYEPIPCGGLDPIDQEREQWTDGANALALAPDVVVLYDRNVRTAEEMDRRGYRVVRADELLLGAVDLSLERPAKSCILTPSGELSRARGGPHCLVHPLRRDAA